MEASPASLHVALAVALSLQKRRAVIGRRLRVSLALTEGLELTMDSDAKSPLSEGWCLESELAILTNARTLEDLAGGRFDPEHPEEEHVFFWSGEDDDFAALQAALRPGRSMGALRAGR